MDTLKIQITDSRLAQSEFKYSTSGSAAFDIRAVNYYDGFNQKFHFSRAILNPNGSMFFDAGFRMQLPKHHCGIIIPRSGLGTKGLVLANTLGLIDNDYRGDIKICLLNQSNKDIEISPLMRVAQLLIINYTRTNFKFVDHLDQSDRDQGGFGSTGI